MVKIYTKTGDKGTTSLFGGKRINKNSERIRAYGTVDELNSLIGVIVAEFGEKSKAPIKLLRIQSELMVLGSDLATPTDVKVKIPRVSKSFIARLEREIDEWEKDLPKLKNFVLPGGGKIGSKLHFARTVARRAEREIVDLSIREKTNQNALMYVNRLSDWLFVLARFINNVESKNEIIWKGRG